MINFIGIYPFQNVLFPGGMHNAVPEFLRPYYPKHKKSIHSILSPIGMTEKNYRYTLGIKSTPDIVYLNKKSKLYKIITSNQSINNILSNAFQDFDFNQNLIDNKSAIHLSASIGNFEIIHYIINKKLVDIDLKEELTGKTALHYAIENGNELMSKYLIKNGASVYETDIYGYDIFDKMEYRGLYKMKDKIEKFINRSYKYQWKENKLNFYIENINEFYSERPFKPSEICQVSIYGRLKNIDLKNIKSFSVYFTKDY